MSPFQVCFGRAFIFSLFSLHWLGYQLFFDSHLSWYFFSGLMPAIQRESVYCDGNVSYEWASWNGDLLFVTGPWTPRLQIIHRCFVLEHCYRLYGWLWRLLSDHGSWKGGDSLLRVFFSAGAPSPTQPPTHISGLPLRPPSGFRYLFCRSQRLLLMLLALGWRHLLWTELRLIRLPTSNYGNALFETFFWRFDLYKYGSSVFCLSLLAHNRTHCICIPFGL